MRLKERIELCARPLCARPLCARTVSMPIICNMIERQPVDLALSTQPALDTPICLKRGPLQSLIIRPPPFSHLLTKTTSPRKSKRLALRVILPLSIQLPPPLVVTCRTYQNPPPQLQLDSMHSTMFEKFGVFGMFDTRFRFHVTYYVSTTAAVRRCGTYRAVRR